MYFQSPCFFFQNKFLYYIWYIENNIFRWWPGVEEGRNRELVLIGCRVSVLQDEKSLGDCTTWTYLTPVKLKMAKTVNFTLCTWVTRNNAWVFMLCYLSHMVCAFYYNLFKVLYIKKKALDDRKESSCANWPWLLLIFLNKDLRVTGLGKED